MIANNANYLSPLSSVEFTDLMNAIGYFEPHPTIAIATSGGADSMALLLLARTWVNTHGGKIIALTVNHNLRLEAASEALQVVEWCKQLDIEQQTLHWEHSAKPTKAIQENAREARYSLLTDYCHKNNILHLLTAHHLDDQVETMFFRLARGSNLSGLSAMSAQTIIDGVRLLRPLLTLPKSRLTATLQANNQNWLEDPSNQNSLYERVHIRKQLAELPNARDIKKSAGNITKKLSKFRNILENNIASELTNRVKIYPMGYAIIDLGVGVSLSEQALSAVIQTISGEQHPPRSEKIDNLHRSIYSVKSQSKYSLSGLLFEVIANKQLLVYREAQVIEKARLVVPNKPFLWDKRFLVECSENLGTVHKLARAKAKMAVFENHNASVRLGTCVAEAQKTPFAASHSRVCEQCLTIRQLGSDGLAQVKKYTPNLLRNSPPARIMRTIPSLWLLEELINIPHIGYMKENSCISNTKFNIKFYPAKPLAGSSFFVMNNQV